MTWNHPVNMVNSRDLVRILWTVLYFIGQLFSAFYRIFYKIANLWNIDLKLLGFISDVNFAKLACLEVAFPKIGVFGNLVCNLQTGPIMSIFFWFCASSLTLISCKNDGHTSGSFRDLRSLQMSVSCQKEQLLLTVNQY